eukprot:s1047_g24.t1
MLVEPIAVRAPSGHSKSAFGEVKLKEEMLSSPMTPGFVAALPGCYHETDRNLLMQIWDGGIKPGAGAEQGRICTFFNVFPPWDSRSWKLVKGTARHRNERAVFYIPTEVLMQEFQGRVTASGQPVTTMTIPFDKIRSAWVEDGRGNWHRLLVPSGPSQLIKSVRSPSRYATRDTIVWEARLCAKAVDEEDAEAAEILDIAVDEEDAEAAEILDIVVGLETRAIRSGTVEEKTNMQKLLTYVIDHKEPDRAGCTVCPACLLSTPVKLSMCLHCKGMMVSHGRKPFKMTKEEVEEAENTPFEGDEKADDDEMKDEEPSDEVKMETDEVNVDDQFDEVHRDLGSFSFNEEEVDYDDDEDEEEEMEVEEEADESKMHPNDENVDDDRVVGDDDDRLRELAEERVRAQQGRNNRYPKWAQPLEIGIKKMPEAYEGVSNIDPDEVSPQILDNTLMVYIAGYYDAYYKYRTETNAETRYEWTVGQTDRLDIDKLGPMNGFEDDGSLRPPTTSTLRPWFDKKARPVAVLDNEMMWEDRPFDAMLLMIETAFKVEKIMAFLVETGLSPKDINYYMPTVEDKADASRRARMRRIISNFIARAIKGAYPEVSTYTYFRDEDDVRDYGSSCLSLPAVGVYYMIRKRYRNLDVAIIAAQLLERCWSSTIHSAHAEDENLGPVMRRESLKAELHAKSHEGGSTSTVQALDPLDPDSLERPYRESVSIHLAAKTTGSTTTSSTTSSTESSSTSSTVDIEQLAEKAEDEELLAFPAESAAGEPSDPGHGCNVQVPDFLKELAQSVRKHVKVISETDPVTANLVPRQL